MVGSFCRLVETGFVRKDLGAGHRTVASFGGLGKHGSDLPKNKNPRARANQAFVGL